MANNIEVSRNVEAAIVKTCDELKENDTVQCECFVTPKHGNRLVIQIPWIGGIKAELQISSETWERLFPQIPVHREQRTDI